MIACSPHSLHLSCPPDSTIGVVNANYGRFSITVCNPTVRAIENQRVVRDMSSLHFLFCGITGLTSYYLHVLCALYMYRTARTLQRHCTENRKKIFPERKLRGLSPNVYINIYVSALYMYLAAYLAAGKEVDRWWEYINSSQIYECQNWE
jgi:hypothetical protein